MFELRKYVNMSIYYLAIQIFLGGLQVQKSYPLSVGMYESIHFRQHAAVKAIDKYLARKALGM